MAIYYFDSSGLVKRYVAEVGSAWVAGLTDPAAGHHIYVANIIAVEVPAAIHKRVRNGDITPADAAKALAEFSNDMAAQYRPIRVTDPIIGAAAALTGRHKLRGYDAVQLEAALEVERRTHAGLSPAAAALVPVTLISADNDLNAAALAEGLAVDNPNNHP